MHVEQFPEAKEEIHFAFNYYEDQSPGLGHDFLDELEKATKKIVRYPMMYPRVSPPSDKSWIGLKRFPFKIIYEVFDEILWINAVMQEKQKPFYWAQLKRPE